MLQMKTSCVSQILNTLKSGAPVSLTEDQRGELSYGNAVQLLKNLFLRIVFPVICRNCCIFVAELCRRGRKT